MSFQDGDGFNKLKKDIYLRKEGEKETLGLHATGMTDENGQFQDVEAWMNVYEDGEFTGSVARIFGSIEETAKDLKEDGWEEYEMSKV